MGKKVPERRRRRGMGEEGGGREQRRMSQHKSQEEDKNEIDPLLPVTHKGAVKHAPCINQN